MATLWTKCWALGLVPFVYFGIYMTLITLQGNNTYYPEQYVPHSVPQSQCGCEMPDTAERQHIQQQHHRQEQHHQLQNQFHQQEEEPPRHLIHGLPHPLMPPLPPGIREHTLVEIPPHLANVKPDSYILSWISLLQDLERHVLAPKSRGSPSSKQQPSPQHPPRPLIPPQQQYMVWQDVNGVNLTRSCSSWGLSEGRIQCLQWTEYLKGTVFTVI